MKYCYKCKKLKDENEFHKNKSGKDGLRNQCKKCEKEYSKEYRKNNKEYIVRKNKEWYENNKRYVAERGKDYRKNNREYILKQSKKWYNNNKKHIKEYCKKNKEKIANRKKEYKKNNEEKILKQRKKWRENNKEQLIKQRKEYYKNNKEKMAKRSKEYKQENKTVRNKKLKIRMQNDPSFKFIRNIRKRISSALKNNSKSAPTKELLGCAIEYARSYLESQFQKGMTWENHGVYGWHIDHIKPCASFDLSDPEQQKICFNYKNLQPLWAKENLSKGSKIINKK